MRQIILPKLEPWQLDVFNRFELEKGKGKIFVIKAKRQIGKSILAVVLLIKYALEGKTTSILLEPTLNQSRRVFKQLVDMLEGSGAIKSANASLLTIDFVNGSEILFKSAEQEDSLRGMTASGILVIDEGAFIKDDIYDIVFPCVDANNSPILIISTPLFTDGRYYQLYMDDNTISFDWSKYDTSKFLSNEKLEQYRKTLAPNKFKSEYLGEFITDGSFVFGDLMPCVGSYSTKPSIYCGIDWACGNDGDFTVVTMFDEDARVTFIDAFNNIDSTEQIKRIIGDLNSHKQLRKVQVELNSIGRVFYDMLRKEYKGNIIGFTTTNDTKRRIIEQLVKAFQSEAITIPNDKELLSELQHYAIMKTAKGYTYNGIGTHDDYVMSMAIAYDLIGSKKGNYTFSFR